MNLFKWIGSKIRRKPSDLQPPIDNTTRIKVMGGRYYPQIKEDGKWITILAIKEYKWYVAPKKFNGYFDKNNAEIIIKWYDEIKMNEIDFNLGVHE